MSVRSHKQNKFSAFTLIELLVVIAIIAILAAILFPVFGRARENGRKAACISNMKQIGTAMLMYTQDYDERLPETGLAGVFRNDANTGLGQLYKGVLPFYLAIQPYAKNYQVFGCNSDPKKQNSSVDRNGMLDMLRAGQVPGVETLPAYSNSTAFHEAVAKLIPNSYGSNYWLSNTYSYPARDGSGTFPADQTQRGRMLTQLVEASKTWVLTEMASNPGNGNAGWYTVPGYLNADANNQERWRGGARHMEGRNWLFADGHVKWHRDAPFTNGATATSQNAITEYYNSKDVFTAPS